MTVIPAKPMRLGVMLDIVKCSPCLILLDVQNGYLILGFRLGLLLAKNLELA